MSAGPLHSVSVAGVTFDDSGRVLLIKRRDNGEWQAPGGVLELDEALELGVIREVFEETGVTVAVEHLSGVYKNLRRGVVSLVYRCRYVSGEATSSDESLEAAWLELDAALARMTPAFATRVQDAADLRCLAASRNHDGMQLLED